MCKVEFTYLGGLHLTCVWVVHDGQCCSFVYVSHLLVLGLLALHVADLNHFVDVLVTLGGSGDGIGDNLIPCYFTYIYRKAILR
jgi:hypothetical protein